MAAKQIEAAVGVNQPIMFFDDTFVEEQQGLVRRLGGPVDDAANPIFVPERPWEGRCVIIWGSVVWDPRDGLFKMWYETCNMQAPKPDLRTMLCYAESQDGIRWHRPNVGLWEWRGSKDNNIVFRCTDLIDTPTIFIDAQDSPDDQRFKMLLFDKSRRSFVRYASPDGQDWHELGVANLSANIGDRHSLMIEPTTGQWRIYHKIDQTKRTVHLASSDDLRRWTEHGEILAPTDADPPETEFYGLVMFPYHQWRLGFLEVFHVLERRLDTQLVRLDEQGRLQRVMPGETFLKRGPWGRWNHTWAFPGNCAPIPYGEELRIYYQGRSTLHWAGSSSDTGHIAAIGLARLRPDGFICLETSAPQATLTTRPFRLQGHYISINVEVFDGGEVRAELLDESGAPLPGFSADDCYPLKSDATYFKLNWSGQSRLDALLNSSLRLRFHLTQTKLYSFRVSNHPRF